MSPGTIIGATIGGILGFGFAAYGMYCAYWGRRNNRDSHISAWIVDHDDYVTAEMGERIDAIAEEWSS